MQLQHHDVERENEMEREKGGERKREGEGERESDVGRDRLLTAEEEGIRCLERKAQWAHRLYRRHDW